MKHTLFMLVAILIIFSLTVPSGKMAAQVQTGDSADAPQAVNAPFFLMIPISSNSYVLPPQPGPQVFINAGNFQMGCDVLHSGGFECEANELPLHTVYLDAYEIDSTEVTTSMYALCVTAGACTLPSSLRSFARADYYGNPEYADFPVINVNWAQAQAYCTWAGGRLPTEAEWEKAARGSEDTRPYPWGEQLPTCAHANSKFITYCVGDTSAVGVYPLGVSPYLMQDMLGNVMEWVSDWYSGTYYTESPASNPTGPASGTCKVLRGGSWYTGGDLLMVADRYYSCSEEFGAIDFGFRCVYPVDR